MGQRNFLEKVGPANDNLIFPLLYTPRESPNSFEEEFAYRFGHYPDYLAAHTYDAINLLIIAIHKAGLNRTLICDKIRQLSPWYGVTGNLLWDSLGSNSRPIELGTIRNGHIEPLSKTKSPPFIY